MSIRNVSPTMAATARMMAFAALALAARPSWAARQTEPALPPCRVSVEVEPREAQVAIDRRPLSELPGYASDEQGRYEVRLAPGDHFAEISAPGFDTAVVPLPIRDGEGNAILARSLEKTTGLALLRSDPPGATIQIGGVSYGTTPKLIRDLPLGTWQATFTLPGYKEATIQFSLKDRTPVAADASLTSDTATLVISASVPDAEIRVNGVARGKAPCRVERIPAGDIIVEATAPGYKDFLQLGKVGEGETATIEARMEELPATLSVYSLPEGARVYVDDNFRGETPLDIEGLAPGDHRIRVERSGFDPMARTVSLTRGNSAAEEFRLKANTGRLSITSVPAGVTVYVDGVKLGETPTSEVKDLSGVLELDGISAGTRNLKFAKPGYYGKSAECTVRRGETTLQRVELQRRFIPDYEVVTETGPHRGVLVSVTAEAVRIETRPGIVNAYQLDKVVSHGPLKEE